MYRAKPVHGRPALVCFILPSSYVTFYAGNPECIFWSQTALKAQGSACKSAFKMAFLRAYVKRGVMRVRHIGCPTSPHRTLPFLLGGNPPCIITQQIALPFLLQLIPLTVTRHFLTFLLETLSNQAPVIVVEELMPVSYVFAPPHPTLSFHPITMLCHTVGEHIIWTRRIELEII